MIRTNSKLEFEVREFTINYFIRDSLTDFEYWVILLTNHAIQKRKSFEDVVKEFVGEDNDLSLLITKRFETLFKGKPDRIREFKEQAKEMEELTITLKPSIATMELYYLKELDLYLMEEQLITLNEVERTIEEEYSTKKKKFNNVIENKTDKTKSINVDVEISNNFKTFNIFNIEGCKNANIISIITEEMKEASLNKLSFDIDKITNKMRKYDEDYKVIDRHFGDKSPLHQILGINTFDNSKVLEFDFSGKGRYVVTDFAIYQGVPLIKEEVYEASEFKKLETYAGYINILSVSYSDLSKKYIEWFIANSDTAKELTFIKETNAYAVNKKESFNKIKTMLDVGVNIINDEIIVKTELIDKYIKEDPILIYKYLTTFYKKKSFVDVTVEKKNEILYNVYNSDSSILLKQDLKEIEDIIKESNLAFEYINKEINGFSSLRSDIKEGLDRIKDILKDETLDDEYISKLTDKEVQLNMYKRIANFFVHIGDNDKSYKKDDKAVKEYNSKLINLKRDWRLFKKQGYLDHIDDEYLIILKGIVNEVKKALKDVK